MRFEDSPNLFGCGLGYSTCGDIECDICKVLHNEGNDAAEDYDGESVCHTEFAGLTVCGCCFEAIENAVLARMRDILPWYGRILKEQREVFKQSEEDLRRALEG